MAHRLCIEIVLFYGTEIVYRDSLVLWHIDCVYR